MATSEEHFYSIAENLASQHDDVVMGKMMSSPGILYKKKNFAFFNDDKMVFKLGKEYDIESHGLSDWSWLQPFKNKGSMKAWYEIPDSEKARWEELANIALEKIKDEFD
jgi:TfoX/Sxy family transcriptional regulator of competence genes